MKFLIKKNFQNSQKLKKIFKIVKNLKNFQNSQKLKKNFQKNLLKNFVNI